MSKSDVFEPLNLAVLTVSDTRTEDTDTSGKLLVERLTGQGHRLADKKIVIDDRTNGQKYRRTDLIVNLVI